MELDDVWLLVNKALDLDPVIKLLIMLRSTSSEGCYHLAEHLASLEGMRLWFLDPKDV